MTQQDLDKYGIQLIKVPSYVTGREDMIFLYAPSNNDIGMGGPSQLHRITDPQNIQGLQVKELSVPEAQSFLNGKAGGADFSFSQAQNLVNQYDTQSKAKVAADATLAASNAKLGDNAFKGRPQDYANPSTVGNPNSLPLNPKPATAAAGSTTQPKPFGIEKILSTLNLGSQGEQVKELQKYLQSTGQTDLKVDGYYGPQTKAAVMQFQSKNGLVADGIFGPKSLGKLKTIASTDQQLDSAPLGSSPAPTKAPDDPSNQFNTATGQPNVNYNPNDNGTPYNTGDVAQDALLAELQVFIKAQQDAGLKINEALNFDQATIDKFLETAKKQVQPFYAQQIETIKADVLRTAPQILQEYGNDIEKQKASFESNLDNTRESFADRGTAFSGQRAKSELGMQSEQDRNLATLSQGYGNKLYELGRNAEQKIGASNTPSLGSLSNYSASLSGNGGFKLSGSSTPYTSGGYQIGSLQNDQAAATEVRNQALKKTASEAVVAGRGYNDLFA